MEARTHALQSVIDRCAYVEIERERGEHAIPLYGMADLWNMEGRIVEASREWLAGRLLR